MAEYDYDVIFIGAGPGGYVGAIRTAQLGQRFARITGRRKACGDQDREVGCHRPDQFSP